MNDMTAQQLIDRSISHTEIVYAAWSAELAHELSLACDDSVDASDQLTEYWGTTDDGVEWRVHLRGTRL